MPQEFGRKLAKSRKLVNLNAGGNSNSKGKGGTWRTECFNTLPILLCEGKAPKYEAAH